MKQSGVESAGAEPVWSSVPRLEFISASAHPSQWWCKTHNREATWINKRGKYQCDPKLGGILAVCDVEEVTW